MKHFDFDVAIIGAGSGGFAAARTVVSAGLSAVVIEGGKEVGGLCILRGCMPTKALLYAAEVKHLAEHGATWGIHTGGVKANFPEVMARKNAMIKDFADYRVQQLNKGKFKFIRAHAKFLDAHTLELSTGSKITAASFVISTGSVSAPPPIADFESVGYITNVEALTLSELPKSLIVLGGGAVAVEFAQFFARMDVQVTIIQRSPHILRDFDPDAATVLEEVLRREGISLFTGTQLKRASMSGGLKKVSFMHEGNIKSIEAQEILCALGRHPNTDGLGLENAGVRTENRRIVADLEMRTSAPHVFAAGDCAGPYEVVHLAVNQGEVAGHNIADPGKPRRMDYRLATAVVFTEPQIAVVGLKEADATARKIPFIAASYPFNDHGKSLIMEAKDGFVKLLADPVSGEIIGGACVGPVGGELIHEIIAAMHKRMTVRELASMPHYHPTLAEIWTYPAEELADKIGLPS
jgi:pyruvate/2-oxoglutarate dehydrogenase complex dihydrolipoamide dehydrogenase (E3) component